MQVGPYKYEVILEHRVLPVIVRKLMEEFPQHGHNFEVWIDEGVLRVNRLGIQCIIRFYEEEFPGITSHVLRRRFEEVGEELPDPPPG